MKSSLLLLWLEMEALSLGNIKNKLLDGVSEIARGGMPLDTADV